MLARGIWARERLRQNGEYTGVLDQSERGHGTLGGGRCERGRKSFEGIDWMAKLAEDTLISNVTIPGTHDSAAYTYSWPFVQTQNMDIATQLNAGIRYFDLRCGLRDEILEMVHGSAFLGLTLTSLLDTLCAWLSKHESEALIVQIKQDRKPERSSVHFAQAIWKCLSKNSARWRTANTTPTLAELRGKIQLLRRFEGPSLHAYGIDVTRWQDNPSRPFTIYGRHQVLLTIQDHYSFPDPESLPNLIATKGGDVAELLNRAAADPDKGHWYINFTSAYEFNLYYQLPPREVAIGGWWAFHWEEGMNPRIRGYLEQHPGRRRYGIVAMDFPEKGADDLIKTLIMSNFGGGESDSRTILQLLVKVVFLLLLLVGLAVVVKFLLDDLMLKCVQDHGM